MPKTARHHAPPLVKTVSAWRAAGGYSRDLFEIIPCYPALYLMTDTRNSTPFQILLPGYDAGDQLAAELDRCGAAEHRWSVSFRSSSASTKRFAAP